MPTPNALDTAVRASREAGALIASHFGRPLQVNELASHDIKLELDVQSQDLITAILLKAHPGDALYGEEGRVGSSDPDAAEWIVDPIDGTVNFFYGLPHFCISIARRVGGVVTTGVIYDPMRRELFTAERGHGAHLNGEAIHVSNRSEIGEAVLSVGFAKSQASIERGLPLFTSMVQSARKCRMMGSAALDLAYVASGRLDAYMESMISLWDVAAGNLLIEEAGGSVDMRARIDEPEKYGILAFNGLLPLTYPYD